MVETADTSVELFPGQRTLPYSVELQEFGGGEAVAIMATNLGGEEKEFLSSAGPCELNFASRDDRNFAKAWIAGAKTALGMDIRYAVGPNGDVYQYTERNRWLWGSFQLMYHSFSPKGHHTREFRDAYKKAEALLPPVPKRRFGFSKVISCHPEFVEDHSEKRTHI